MNLDHELKAALRRKTPGPGLAGKVLERIEREQAVPRGRNFFGSLATRRIAAVLTLTAMLGGWAAHQEFERRRGERAKDEVLLALHIAGAKVRAAQKQVRGE